LAYFLNHASRIQPNSKFPEFGQVTRTANEHY
jgi:hypothetical protein